MFIVCQVCEGSGFFKSGKHAVLCRNCGGAGKLYVPGPAVFRTHRKAVWQAAHKRAMLNVNGRVSFVVPSAQLGCELARARLKKRVRVQNGIKLGRWSRSREPRAVQTWKTNPWSVLLHGVVECL
jgi:hypothetical protein